MAGIAHSTPSEIRLGTVLRAILGSAMIAALGVLWVLQSREHQQLQDQITLTKSNCTVLTHLILQDGRELDPLLTRPSLLAKVQELGLGLTNITYGQVFKVTNSARERSLDITSRRPSPQVPAPAIATAVPR
jgi:hypothetical protein